MKRIVAIVLMLAGTALYAGPNEEMWQGIKECDYGRVILAVEMGADVNSESPNHIDSDTALVDGCFPIAHYLIRKGADSYKPYVWAYKGCYNEERGWNCLGHIKAMFPLFTKRGWKMPRNILATFLYEEKEPVILRVPLNVTEYLLRRGADPNAKFSNGMTPLEYARGSHEIAALLIKYGAK